MNYGNITNNKQSVQLLSQNILHKYEGGGSVV